MPFHKDTAALNRLRFLTHPGTLVGLTQSPVPLPPSSRSLCIGHPQARDGDLGKRQRISCEAGLWRKVAWLYGPGDVKYIDTGAGRKPRSALILPLQFIHEETEAQMA